MRSASRSGRYRELLSILKHMLSPPKPLLCLAYECLCREKSLAKDLDVRTLLRDLITSRHVSVASRGIREFKMESDFELVSLLVDTMISLGAISAAVRALYDYGILGLDGTLRVVDDTTFLWTPMRLIDAMRSAGQLQLALKCVLGLPRSVWA